MIDDTTTKRASRPDLSVERSDGRPLRVLLVTNDFPPRVGGVQTYLFQLYRRLAESGVEVTVLAPYQNGMETFDGTLPERMRIVRRRQVLWPTPLLTRDVRRLSEDVDVVATGATLPMVRSVHRCGKPVVMHTHGLEVAWMRMPHTRLMLRRLLAKAALTTVVSDFTARELARVIKGPIARLHMGVDLEQFPPDLDVRLVRERYGLDGSPVIAFVSRLVPRKGADQLIRVLPALRKQIPGARLLVVGDGRDATRLRRLAASANLPADAVVFTGSVPIEELPFAYAAGDIFAMPCRDRLHNLEVEALGIVYLEAQAVGRATVTGLSGGAPETIRAGETGVAVDGTDRAALLDVLVALLANPAGTAEMGRKARAFMEAEFDQERIARDLHAHLASVARR